MTETEWKITDNTYNKATEDYTLYFQRETDGFMVPIVLFNNQLHALLHSLEITIYDTNSPADALVGQSLTPSVSTQESLHELVDKVTAPARVTKS